MKSETPRMFLFTPDVGGIVCGVRLLDGRPALLASSLAGICGSQANFCPYHHLIGAIVSPDHLGEICVGTELGPMTVYVITTPAGAHELVDGFSYYSEGVPKDIHKWLDDAVIPVMWPGSPPDSAYQRQNAGRLRKPLDSRFVPAVEDMVREVELHDAWDEYEYQCRRSGQTADVETFCKAHHINLAELQKARYNISLYDPDWGGEGFIDLILGWYANWVKTCRVR